MAIGTPTLRQVAGAVTTATTASFTPTANSKLFAWGSCGENSATPATKPTISDSLGGSWTEIGEIAYSGTGFSWDAVLWYQEIGGSPSSMTVTVTGANDNAQVVTYDITGVGDDFSNQSTATSATGDPSGSLSSFSTGGAGFGHTAAVGNNNFTPPSGYTELYDASPPTTTTRRHSVVYDLTSPGTTLTWASNNVETVAFLVEFKEATSAQTITGALFSDGDTFQVGAITTENTITGSLYDDPDTFYSATIGAAAQDITGALFTDGDTFQAATITAEATILGALYSDADTFHAATLTTSADIVGAVYVDPDTFHSATVQGQNTITGALVTDPDTFFAATISPGAATIQGSLYIDPDTFYNGVVTGGSSSGGSTGAIMLRRRRR